MRFFDIIRTANHNLFRNKVRTFLTILAIFIGSLTIILNAAINTGVNSFIDDQTASLGGEDYIMIMSKGSAESVSSMMMSGNEPTEYNPKQTMSAMNDEQLDKLAQIDGFNKDDFYVSKQIPVEYISSKATDKKYNITVGAMPPGDFTIATTAGRLPEQNTKKYEITLQAGFPEALGFRSDKDAIDKTITLTFLDPLTNKPVNFNATVVGVQAKGVVAVNCAIISHALEEAMYKEGTKNYPTEQKELVYSIQTRFDNNLYTETEIKQILEDNGFYGVTVSDMMGSIRTFFDVIMIIFMIFGGIALLAAAIGIINTLYMSVEERTREIGLDKALGMSSGKVFLSFAVEAILLGFWGSVFGVAAAMAIGYAANFYVHQPGGFLVDFPTFELMKFTPENILPIIGIIMLIAFLAGTLPARRAARKNPIDALRYE